jgi:hypothetical protein
VWPCTRQLSITQPSGPAHLDAKENIMTNNPQVPLSPEDPEDSDVPVMQDDDGEEKLDPDLNEDLIDSSEADRLAAESETRER